VSPPLTLLLLPPLTLLLLPPIERTRRFAQPVRLPRHTPQSARSKPAAVLR
jgi:hypothetical protein